MQISARLQTREAPARREPAALDWLMFFTGFPVGIALLFSLVGVRLIAGMPYLDGLGYMVLHMFVAWWSVSAGSWLVRFVFHGWQPPVLAICVMGFFVSLVPAGFLFQRLGEFYGSVYPLFAANRADVALPSWDIDYLVHFIRYSIPALPLFLAGVFSYRYITGVDWFGYDPGAIRRGHSMIDRISGRTRRPVAGLIEGSKLPADAELIAVKAEQHYIHIWSDQGTDMVRYRFGDLIEELKECNGAQVHRSWWINLDQVQSRRSTGRKFELELSGNLTVPVSRSFKNNVIECLG